MDIGAAIFFTDYSMGPAELGRALEERGFESLWAPEHSHIPLSRQSPFPQGGDLPKKYYDVMDPFVTLAAAAAATTRLQRRDRHLPGVQRDPDPDRQGGRLARSGLGRALPLRHRRRAGTRRRWRTTAPTSRRASRVMRERVEAMKAIWTKSKPEYHGEFVDFPPDDDVAQAGAEAASAGDRGRRVPARRAPGASPTATAGFRTCAGRSTATATSRDSSPSSAKMAAEAGRDPAAFPVTISGKPGRRRQSQALSGRRRGPLRLQSAVRQGRRDPADPRSRCAALMPIAVNEERHGLAGARRPWGWGPFGASTGSGRPRG